MVTCAAYASHARFTEVCAPASGPGAQDNPQRHAQRAGDVTTETGTHEARVQAVGGHPSAGRGGRPSII